MSLPASSPRSPLSLLLIGVLLLLHSTGAPAAYTWKQRADFGGGERFVPFYFSIGNKGYCGSGITIIGSVYNYTYIDFWEYDESTNTWTQQANMPAPCRSSAAGFSINGKGYVTTGWTPNPTSTTHEYNPATNAWIPRAAFGGGARHSTAYFSLDKFAYVGMGYAPFSLDFWRYDVAGDLWIQVAGIGGSPRQAATGFAVGGKGYVFGGTTALSTETSELWAFEPVSNAWSQQASMPGAPRYGASSFVMDNMGFVGLGASGSSIFNDFYAYDPVSNTWTAMPPLPAAPRYGAFSFSLNNKGFIGAGSAAIVPANMLMQDMWELSADSVTSAATDALPVELGLSVTPNPNDGRCTVSYAPPLGERGRLTIRDVSGRLVFDETLTESANRCDVDITGKPDGMYIVTLEYMHAFAIGKLLKGL